LAALVLLGMWTIVATSGRTPHSVLFLPAEELAVVPVESLAATAIEVLGDPTLAPSDAAASASVPIDELVVPEVPDVALADFASSSAASLELDAMLSVGEGKGGGLADAPVAEFFGVQARGRTFVFVVDSSNSMRVGKLDAAKEELLYAIRRLSPDQLFYVIFFNGNTVPMMLGDTGEPEPEPVPATTENFLRLEQWVDTVHVDPWTDPHVAMQRAVEMSPDAIFLLSDGRFTDRGETIRYLKRENYVRDSKGRRPKVVIHTVGFHQRDGEATLKNIARSYGGSYRFIPPPKSKP
jgi:hypothetical protein